MPFIETGIPGLKVFEPRVFGDSRGYFFESYNKQAFTEAGIQAEFVQDNESMSNRGVVRGLHYQHDPDAQSKLVRVISGEVLDVVVDIRKGSPTFGQVYSILLSAENKKQLFIPRGFAHGFSVLQDNTIFSYKCDNFYNPKNEGGIYFRDPAMNIDWMISPGDEIVSGKDKGLPTFADCINGFEYRP
jgi:dTDP-4-dehydrorhamnose 3,5-epimerase